MSRNGDGHGPFQGQTETDLSDLLGLSDAPTTAPTISDGEISFLDANRDLVEAGASVHWLKPGEKRPASRNWSDVPNQTLQDLRRDYLPGQNIGIRLGRPSMIGQDYLHVMDLDIRDSSKADVAWAALLKLLPDAKSLPTVVSGSGGESRHIYFLTDTPFRKKKLAHSGDYKMVFDAAKGRKVKKYDWEIDLMGTGSQAVLPPSIHPVTGQPYRWDRTPDLVFPFMMKINGTTQANLGARIDTTTTSDAADDDETYLETILAAQPLDLTAVEVSAILEMLPAHWVEDRDSWLTVGAALHHQFEGKQAGFDRWCEWSKQSAKFDDKDSARVWKSFKGSKNPVRMATLIKAAGWSRASDGSLSLDAAKRLAPTLFVLSDPKAIPPREWVYGKHLIRKFASATVAQPGVGKSSLTIADAIAMASGREIVGVKPFGKLRVWIWNGEDPQDELIRRVTATCIQYGITQDDLGGRLMVDSGRDLPIKIAFADRQGTRIATPVVDKLIVALIENRVDVLILDPFISTHGVPENDNNAMDLVIKQFAAIADAANCAIDLVHHTRKLNGAEADIDSSRGASAISGAVRAARVLNGMSKQDAARFAIPEADRRSYVRIDNGKNNLAPAENARWVKLVNVWLDNATNDRTGDGVGVVTPWQPPAPMEICTAAQEMEILAQIDGQNYREDAQVREGWVGDAIAEKLSLDPSRDKPAIKRLVKAWLDRGIIVSVKKYNSVAKKEVPVIEVVKSDSFDDGPQSMIA